MSEIKGLSFNNDSAELLTSNGGEMDGTLIVEGNLIINNVISGGNGNSGNGDEDNKPKINSFAEATDEDIAYMLEMHYNNEINIQDYWAIGDERVIHLYATAASSNNNTPHAAQDITIVIVDFNHDNLTEPINGHTKAAVSIACREVLGNNGTMEGEYWAGIAHGSTALIEHPYPDQPIRTYLNETFIESMPLAWTKIIKFCNKNSLARHASTTGSPKTTQDKAWLPSIPEVLGNVSMTLSTTNLGSTTYTYLYYGNSTYEEGQYNYYTISNNRIKYPNNNGKSGEEAVFYWTRSIGCVWQGSSSDTRYCDCYILKTGAKANAVRNDSASLYGICPHFAI